MAINQRAVDNDLVVLDELADFWAERDFALYPHQIETAQRVIDELDGRALLADEVGLGKTIEAGLILKEYILRGEVETVLILTPASLSYQWWVELTNKFDIDIFNNRKGKGWHYFDHQIASIDLAKRERHAEVIYQRDFDMVIVDEAHKLKNSDTLNWQFVNNLSPEYMLFLTATPIQNDLDELYNLVSLLKSELFRVNDSDLLKQNLDQVMIRNERTDSELDFTDRDVKLIPLELTSPEQQLYDGITELVKQEYDRCRAENRNLLHLVTLQREICSSSFAVIETLQNFLNSAAEELVPKVEQLLQLAEEIQINQKVQVVEELLKEIDGQAVIFTEYLATQNYICYYLYQRGLMPVKFDGTLNDTQKERAKRFFAEQGDVLVSTAAGRQGINLQFCNVIINYDLPWNPMKLEQRIGRVHRLGQTEEVKIYNLCTKGTIEEKIVNVLHDKINLFESVVGNLDKIVNNSKEHNLDKSILDVIVNQEGEELEKSLEELLTEQIK
ncbi:DEAD/DEAH box helicase [Acetohalobium arabaticum]|uniref:Helicase domain protein n=1 Tax=Acetohalobium arabaticum (strain ATCC 49924 / DSM 5501 / Z-7288) TaxID=574087 RepID=D9QRC0_ACEAZ|nr:SNF2-related protein [Acetohalobium arabaticum]ADL13061.1 helicase domain protein [Acetohalobium arabaticum DSM 5501]